MKAIRLKQFFVLFDEDTKEIGLGMYVGNKRYYTLLSDEDLIELTDTLQEVLELKYHPERDHDAVFEDYP